MTGSKKHRHSANSEPKAKHEEAVSNLPASAFNKFPADHEPPADRAKPDNKAKTDVWMYRAEGPRLFKAGETIPDGYVDSPAKVDAWR